MINWRYIFHLLGLLLVIEGAFQAVSALVSVIAGDKDLFTLFASALITGSFGGLMWMAHRKASPEMGKKEGYILVSLVWLAYAFFGAIPYFIGGYIPSFLDACFESMSGLTTCGASILTDIEALPRGIVFWRSFTTGIGGIGILVMVIAILPTYGAGSMMLYRAEASEGTRLSPRIKDTAKWLISLYLGLIVFTIILYVLGGMSLFDAVCHSFPTIATAGFSTKNASFAAFSPAIQYISMFCMLLGSISFVTMIAMFRGQFKKAFPNDELKLYLKVVVGAVLFTAGGLYLYHGMPLEQAFRDGGFQVVSIISTTGFVSADYMQWGAPIYALLFLLMFLGGCAGSTAGGIKMVRLLVLLRSVRVQFQKILHQRGMLFVKMNRHNVPEAIIARTLSFFMMYLMAFSFGAFGLMLSGLDFISSLGASITCLGCIGPGLGSVGPVENYAHLTEFGKTICMFLMLLGRLELYSFLILFLPEFWKKN